MTSKLPVIFIVNSNGTTVRRRGSVLLEAAEDLDVKILEITDFNKITEELKALLQDKPAHLFLEGGDGTLHGVMTHFLKLPADIVQGSQVTIVPGGMTNQVARNVGLKSRDLDKIKELARGENVDVQTLPILEISSGPETVYGFLFTTGGVPMATTYCKSEVHNRGIGGSFAVFVTMLAALGGRPEKREKIVARSRLSLGVDDGIKEINVVGDHLGTMVTTLPGLILGLDPFWGDGDGALRTTYIEADAQHILRHLFMHWAGRTSNKLENDGLRSWCAHRLNYEYAGPVMLDGEDVPIHDHKFTITPSQPVNFAT